MDTKLGIIKVKTSRGKPPTLQSTILAQLVRNGIQSKTRLARTLEKNESNISRSMSILQHNGIVMSYQSIKKKKKRGRPRNIEIRDVDSSNVNLGRPHQLYGLTEKGIKLLLSKEFNLNLEMFWRLIFHYFKPKNQINKMNIRDAFNQYEIDVLGCERKLAFTTIILQNYVSIDTIKTIINNKKESIHYIDLLCTMAYQDLLNMPIINKKLKTKIFLELDDLNLVKLDPLDKSYSLTLLGILFFLQLLMDAADNQKEIKSLGLAIVVVRANDILAQIEKIRNDRHYLDHIKWPNEVKKFIFPYTSKLLGGSTWKDSIFYNALLDPFFEYHSKKLPRVFGKLKKLKMIWSSKEIYLGLAFILKQVSDYEPMPRRYSMAGGDGFQEIIDDFENMSSYYEEALEKEYSVGFNVYCKLNTKNHPNFDEENLYASDMIDELRMRLGFNVDKKISEKMKKELANHLYEDILPEWISFKFYTYLFQKAKDEYKFDKWMAFFQKDKDLTEWYCGWLDKLMEYRKKATNKQLEFRNLFIKN